jgi:hypothetical protein
MLMGMGLEWQNSTGLYPLPSLIGIELIKGLPQN